MLKINLIIKHLFFFYIIFCQIVLICFAGINSVAETLRLPNHTIPINYDIFLKINNDELTFDGITNIELFIQNNTNEIILHSKNLTNFKLNIIDLDYAKEIKNITYNYDYETNFLKVFSTINDFLFKKDKKYLLRIYFCGKINKEEEGIHKSFDNNIRYSITTLFQPTFARKAFPCFDEPQLKARFNLTLNYPSKFNALSNMPAIKMNSDSETNEIDLLRKTTKFHQTPIMSCYLLAFVLHNFFNVSANNNNITQTVYYQNLDQKINAEFTIQTTSKIIETLENLLGHKYILSKLDHFFQKGNNVENSMENLGLIIYSDIDMLISGTCTTDDINIIILVVHEIAHQWFGNLITMKWWTYLWLNEGFATYYSYIIADKIFPDCNIMDYFSYDIQDSAFLSSIKRPLSHYVENETDINDLFDEISYNKGAVVLMMSHYLLSNVTFNKGIHNYLEKFQYSVVDEDNLFKCLEDAALKDNIKFFNKPEFFRTFMKTWTHNKGYPILTVHRNYTNDKITLTQTTQDRINNKKWFIPITFATTFNSNFNNLKMDFIMPIETITIMPHDFNLTLSSNSWLLLNKQYIGFYRINYDRNNWLLIAKQLCNDPDKIHKLNKIQIIRDIIYFLKSESIDLISVLEILSYLRIENSVFPWIEVTDLLNEFSKFIDNDDLLKYFLKDISQSIFHKMINTKMNVILEFRLWMYGFFCKLVVCSDYMNKEFQQYNRKNKITENDFESIIFTGCIKNISGIEILIGLNKIVLYEKYKEKFNFLIKPYLCTENLPYINVILEKTWKIYNVSKSGIGLCDIIDFIFTNNNFGLTARPKLFHYISENFDIIKYMCSALIVLPVNENQLEDVTIEKNTLRNNNYTEDGLYLKLQEPVVRQWLAEYKINREASNII